jgi:non-ribosomal peptide synthetase component F
MLLTERFAAMVALHGERLAVDVPPGPGRALRATASYAELAAMAEAVRQQVARHGTGERLVVVLLSRTTAWLYAAQLGVLQAGAAHVCLDPSFPDAHLAHVARDAQAVAVVTDEAGAARCRRLGVPCLVAAALQPAAAPLPRPAWVTPGSLAYVIYTSGTTGLPKGVLIEHAGAVNLIRQGVARFGIGPGDRIAQGSSAAYDSSLEETWLALASGGTVVALDDETVRLGPDLVPWLRRERISVFCPPPTLLRAMDVDVAAHANCRTCGCATSVAKRCRRTSPTCGAANCGSRTAMDRPSAR